MYGRIGGVIESSKETEEKEEKIFSRKEYLNWDLYGG